MKYISYYSLPSKEYPRNSFLSATNKMDYIIGAMVSTGRNVEIISASGLLCPRIQGGKTTKLKEDVSLKTFFSIGNKSRKIRSWDRKLITLQLFFYLMFHIRKGEDVLVYHSLGYIKLIRWLKKLKKFRLILEVEEIYADVLQDADIRKKEMDYFQLADAYFFPTELLDGIVNRSGKPSLIIYGTYKVESPIEKSIFNDNKIHVVYAGTLDPKKGGAIATVSMTEFLDTRFHVHILGFGTSSEIEAVKDQIASVQSKCSATVSYDGVLHGDDYTRFLQSCQIGLSTQIVDAAFSQTSFPSKVLSYMANGLRVVSSDLDVLRKSSIGNLIYYYDGEHSKSLAQAITRIDLDSSYDSRTTLKSLDRSFKNSLDRIL